MITRVEREAQERKLETRRNSQAMLMGGLRLNFKTSQVLPSSNLQLFGFRQRRACRVGGGFVHDGFGQVVLTEERGKGSGREWKYKMEGEVLAIGTLPIAWPGNLIGEEERGQLSTVNPRWRPVIAACLPWFAYENSRIFLVLN